jgi:hypothetical protein
VKWAELRRTLGGKLKASKRQGKKHDLWFVECDGRRVGEVLDSHGQGEMTNREIGHVASSLNLSERQVRELVSCTLSKEEFCARQ